MYAPSTIALSALLISFSHYKVPCGAWVNSIPMYFFINEENPFFQCMQGLDESGAPLCPTALFLDHESCIAAFERMHNLRRSPVPSSNSSGKSGNSSCQSSLCSSPTPTTSSCGTSENSPVSVSDRALCRSQQT